MPRTTEGWTNLPPTPTRLRLLEIVCGRLFLDPNKHKGRLGAVDYALRSAAELPLTGAEPLASAVTRVLVAAGQIVAGERGARQKLERAWARYCQALDEK